MSAISAFMEGPLVTWVRTFSASGRVDFQDLCDGVYLCDVLLQIDQRDLPLEVNRLAKDANARIQNWSRLLHRMQSYYQDMLQQLVVMELPNIVAMVKEPTKDSSLMELKKVLLLLLGCAVQCEQKEAFITTITHHLDISTQAAIAEYIKQITDTTENVFGIDIVPGMDEALQNLYNVLKNVAAERDKYSESIVQLTQERDYYRVEAEGKKGPFTAPPSLERYHLSKELAEYKNRVHNLTDELEEKTKTSSDLKDELETAKSMLNKLKNENVNLSKDARSARTYRDELDTLREKASKSERYEKEIHKYKEKLSELEFYKSRVQELREDNNVLNDARQKMEDQLTSGTKRIATLMDEVVRAQIALEESVSDKDQAQKKLHELLEENATLEFERSNMREGFGGIKRILSFSSSEFLGGSQLRLSTNRLPISEELNESAISRMSRLELENDELRQDLEEVRKRLDEAEKELQHQQQKVDREYRKKVEDLEVQSKELKKRASMELSREFQHKLLEIEKQGKDLKERVTQEYKAKVGQLEIKAKELEKQNKQIHEQWVKDKGKCTTLEKLNKELKAEKDQFRKMAQTVQQTSDTRIRELEREVETVSTRLVNVQKQNDKISNVCDEETNKDGTKYMNMRNPMDQPQPHGSPRRTYSTAYAEPSGDKPYSQPPRSPSRAYSATYVQSQELSRGRMSSPTMGGVHSNSLPQSPARGVVVPQRRCTSPGAPVVATETTTFVRDSKVRATIAPIRHSTDSTSFTRNTKHRASMPERKTMYVAPERRHASSSSHNSVPTERVKSYHKGYHTQPSSPYKSHHHHHRDGSHSDHDSGHATSPDSPISEHIPNGSAENASLRNDMSDRISIASNASIQSDASVTSDASTWTNASVRSGASTRSRSSIHSNATDRSMQSNWEDHYLTSVQVVKRSSRTTTSSKTPDKWKKFVDKIMELQDKNQKLIAENTELRRVMNSMKYSTERLDQLEEKNLQLEVENKKLKKIIEMLQATTGSPYDKRTYHYYSNV